MGNAAKIRFALAIFAFALAASGVTARAEQTSRVHLLGILFTSALADDPSIRALAKGLSDYGYVEGRDFRFEYVGRRAALIGFRLWPRSLFSSKWT